MTDTRGLVLQADEYGLRLDSDLEEAELQHVVNELRVAAGNDYRVMAEKIPLDGPVEVLLAISEVAGAVGGLAGGAAGVLALFVKRNPQRPVTVVLRDESRIVITNEGLSEQELELLKELLKETERDPGPNPRFQL